MSRLTFLLATTIAILSALCWWQRASLAPVLARTEPSWMSRSSASAGADVAGGNVSSGPPPIPVTSADIANADFPVYLDGLGTVQPFDTVTVRSRVDGQITNVLFKQGQMVKKGDPLLEIDKRPFQAALDQAVAKKAQDEATLRNAKLDLQRYSTLAKQEFSSRQQLDTQQALVDQVAAQVQGDQSTIDSARTQLDYSTITSPLTGRTGFRLVDPGNIIHATDANGVVTIVRMQPISIVFTAPEGALPAINKALAAGDVPVDALTSDGKTVLSHGRLALVDNSVASASGTISMKATFENSDDALWPGQSVSTRMRVDLLKQVTVVPEDAVQHGPNGLLAYVIGRDDRVAPRPIEVSQIGNGEAVVTKGLSAGEKIVVEGQYRLQPGSKVQASPMAPPVESEKLAQADH